MYQNYQDPSLPSGSDILRYVWTCRASAIYDMPINWRYIQKRCPALVWTQLQSNYFNRTQLRSASVQPIFAKPFFWAPYYFCLIVCADELIDINSNVKALQCNYFNCSQLGSASLQPIFACGCLFFWVPYYRTQVYLGSDLWVWMSVRP